MMRRLHARRAVPAISAWPDDTVLVHEDGSAVLVRVIGRVPPHLLDEAVARGDLRLAPSSEPADAVPELPVTASPTPDPMRSPDAHDL